MDGLMGVVDTAVTSPWFYLALFAVAFLDGFFPVVPSESMVITAGVYAASGRPELVPVVSLAAAGAFLGDHVSYLVGRRAGGRLVRGARPGTRRHAAFGWARRTMDERGGLILVVARYVPGGRTAVTLTMGAVGYRLRSFSLFAAVAAVSWALYGALLGYVGGVAFEDDPLKGVAVGLGLALGVTGAVEAVRFARRRRRGARDREGSLEGAGAVRPGQGPGERRPAARVGPMPGE
ncbi:membrane protein DedA with SNARE-associated domain [Actinomadura luteofluorescens]|uniref:Membrane protein DedA with SNARE-associated domain n=1 Tax=Actinomadura luteofluorescens TaxID=46163 RepID=A0A7Y9ES04_9ACTN|nr:DedA family protein [Actinomadura luteofluorescens]NYD52877.1 membrane protein DedA with SNARE-associated domain [Actinomadura luteofluorescens]